MTFCLVPVMRLTAILFYIIPCFECGSTGCFNCSFCPMALATICSCFSPADVHKMELAEKFKALKEKGQVKKFLKKKMKRNASKHSKAMPRH